ncbi:mitochondrial 54S ribosomal protein mL53 [Dipodascopsis tothii]|uniref:mitochondrial 54S ribosomal protein mL53 n=1 Tax=Dipodascopsis tothii TaxID=44089 RepID=UPI0034CD4137
MITKYFQKVEVRFNPFVKGKTARVFLARIPPTVRQQIKVQSTVLPQDSTAPSLISVQFKDGKNIEVDPTTVSIVDVVEELDRHSRVLRLNEQINA